MIKQNSQLDHTKNFYSTRSRYYQKDQTKENVKDKSDGDTIPGHSPKLGGCQGECPYPCDYVSFFGGGDVIFLAMMHLSIRFSSSSLLTCCLRSFISFRSSCNSQISLHPRVLHSCGRTSNTLFHIFIREKFNIGRDDRGWNG